MLGSAKELKRDNWEYKGILIGPLKAPHFFSVPKLRRRVFLSLYERQRRFWVKFRGADGKPTPEPW